jgi:hypothetical protein
LRVKRNFPMSGLPEVTVRALKHTLGRRLRKRRRVL